MLEKGILIQNIHCATIGICNTHHCNKQRISAEPTTSHLVHWGPSVLSLSIEEMVTPDQTERHNVLSCRALVPILSSRALLQWSHTKRLCQTQLLISPSSKKIYKRPFWMDHHRSPGVAFRSRVISKI